MSKRTMYKSAVSLIYDREEDPAPLIAAKGFDFSADEIVRIAKRFGVPVVEKGELASALATFDESSYIPEELYETVAVLLNEIEKS